MKFDELYKKVIDSCRAFEERQVPIRLDFKIEDLRDALIESNDTIEELKQKLEDAKATAYTESVDAGMENHKLKRALWMHRAITAKLNKDACKAMREYNPFIGIEEYKWQEVERKCRAKAEEYK